MTYVFHPVTSTDDLDDMWAVHPNGERVKMRLASVDEREPLPSGGDRGIDPECGNWLDWD